jgi:uncharacterized protein (DUF433 family)
MNQTQWKYLEAHPQSSYKQLFIKGTRIRAEIIYYSWLDAEPPEPTTPEEVAADWNVSVEAVREAIAYCQSNPPEREEDHREARAEAIAKGWMDAEGNWIRPAGRLSPEEEERLGLND